MGSPPFLKTLTNRILGCGPYDYGGLFTACDALYNALIELIDINVEENKNREHLFLDQGSAIGLSWAALCLKDFMRTKRFMDAVYQATQDRLEMKKERPVQILYAGTGPFATLVLPLAGLFTSGQVQFTLLEVNEASFETLEKLIGRLQLVDYVHRMERADATKWKIPQNESFDLFICETMQQALKKEPQVAICINLLPQLSGDTIMIPQQIDLYAGMINPSQRSRYKMQENETDNGIHTLGKIFALNRETIMEYAPHHEDEVLNFPIVSQDIPAELLVHYPELCLLTEIRVYREYKLLLDESPLTMPVKLVDISSGTAQNIRFRYQTGKKPGIQYSMEKVTLPI